MGLDEGRLRGRRLPYWLARIAELAFAGLVILTLSTPSWRYGPFAWLPLWRTGELAGGPVDFGVLNLLPLVLALSWLGGRLLTRVWPQAAAGPWLWGRAGVTLPLLGLTLWGLLNLNYDRPRIVFIQAGGLALAWLIYLYLLNERPGVVLPLGVVMTVQGSVALAQFLKQGDLGLVFLGELPLNPIFTGVSVVTARGQPWLRAYGLTAHPNLLGAILAACLLLLLPVFGRLSGWRRAGFDLAYGLGLVGLGLSFSRAAMLGYLVGLLAWLWLRRRTLAKPLLGEGVRGLLRRPVLLMILAALVVLALLYGDLALSRVVALDTPTEARSLNERLADDWRALTLIGQHPLQGVGLGEYTDAARSLDPAAVRVHNVPLLVTAELGFPGLILLIWLAISGLRSRPAGLVPWLAVLLIGFFDTTLWLTSNWQTALLFALIAANLSDALVTGPPRKDARE